MDWRSACAAVIPCLNEESAIGPLVTAVREHINTVFVLDDGSTDETASAANHAGATVLRNPSSRGKGAALRRGWSHALEQCFSWTLCLDGDGQHSPADIPEFFREQEATGASLIVGNRMAGAAAMPLARRWANVSMSRHLSKICGRPLPDSQCGFRLMQLNQYSRLPISAEHFEIESDVLYQFARAGLDIRFVPIRVIYRSERSKIRVLRDTLRWLTWLRCVRQADHASAPLLR